MKTYKYTRSFTFEGKRYFIHADTLEEIGRKKALKLMELQKGVITYDKTMLVREWAPRALEVYRHNKDNYDTQKRFEKYIFPVIGHYPLYKVTAIQCQKIMNSAEGMSFSFVQKLSQDLNFIFKKAVDNGLIPANPAQNIDKPNSYKGTRRSLTERELSHFKAISENNTEFLLFELMLECGCRPGEAIDCIKKDIEIIDGERMLHIRGTKTANSDRYVPFPDVLWNKVKKYSPFDLLAPNKANNRHTDSSYRRLSDSLRREMNISMGCKVYRNALVPPLPLANDFVPYCFRHTYCTNLAKAGVDIRTAQRLMGHADISITANIYTHVDNKDIVKAAEQIRMFKGVTEGVTV